MLDGFLTMKLLQKQNEKLITSMIFFESGERQLNVIKYSCGMISDYLWQVNTSETRRMNFTLFTEKEYNRTMSRIIHFFPFYINLR